MKIQKISFKAQFFGIIALDALKLVYNEVWENAVIKNVDESSAKYLMVKNVWDLPLSYQVPSYLAMILMHALAAGVVAKFSSKAKNFNLLIFLVLVAFLHLARGVAVHGVSSLADFIIYAAIDSVGVLLFIMFYNLKKREEA